MFVSYNLHDQSNPSLITPLKVLISHDKKLQRIQRSCSDVEPATFHIIHLRVAVRNDFSARCCSLLTCGFIAFVIYVDNEVLALHMSILTAVLSSCVPNALLICFLCMSSFQLTNILHFYLGSGS